MSKVFQLSRHWARSSTAFLISLAVSTSSMIAAETELSVIQTRCKTYFQARQPIFVNDPGGLGNGPGLEIPFNTQERQAIHEISGLIDAKKWDESLDRIQKQSQRIRLEMFPQLLRGLIRADELNRATQLVITLFSPQSYERSQGIGMIASELIMRNQLSDAIALLKTISQTPFNITEATNPVLLALIATKQPEKFQSIAKLFPKAQTSIWLGVGGLPIEPQVFRQLTGMIDDSKLRSYAQEKTALYWFSRDGKERINGWIIANQIDDCMIRARALLRFAERITDSLSSESMQEKSKTLDHISELLNVVDEAKLGDRRA